MTVSEAVRTSVLSTRWINLWKSVVAVLDFDGWNLLQLPVINTSSSEENDLENEEIVIDPDDIIIEDVPWEMPPRKTGIVAERRLMYINWVNGVLSQLNGCSKITKFRIWFNFEIRCNSEGDIDRWLEFAISKRVEYLEISLGEADMVFDILNWHDYVFSEACFQHIKLLVVTGSPSSPLPLKYLEVRSCFCLESLEIDYAPSLTSFSYGDRWVELCVKNCSSLVHLSLAFADDYKPAFAFEYLSDYADQFGSLALEIHTLLQMFLTS
ncbi:hypothetical protein LINPERHAP1_LOCUS39724 [Linum perenne]